MPEKEPLLSDYELMECIERGLAKFGSNVKYAVIWRMVVLGDSPKEGILAKPQAFVSALKSIFGSSAKIIEWEVLDQIKERIHPEYSEVQDFVLLVSMLRREQNLRESLLITNSRRSQEFA
jgi:hypothetical protein